MALMLKSSSLSVGGRKPNDVTHSATYSAHITNEPDWFGFRRFQSVMFRVTARTYFLHR